jgi:hypothetical protein
MEVVVLIDFFIYKMIYNVPIYLLEDKIY